jgi:hypothetical protein
MSKKDIAKDIRRFRTKLVELKVNDFLNPEFREEMVKLKSTIQDVLSIIKSDAKPLDL